MKFLPFVIAILLLILAGLAWFLFQAEDEIELEPNSVEVVVEGSRPSRDLGLSAQVDSRSELERTAGETAEASDENRAVQEEEARTVVTIRSSVDGLPVAGVDVYAYSPASLPARTENLLLFHYDFIRAESEHYLSDKDGRVRIRACAETTQLLALDERYEGYGSFPRGEKKAGLRVQPYTTILVRVVDQDGRPGIDLPVVLRSDFNSPGGIQSRDSWTGRTRAPDGLVRVPLYRLFQKLKPSRMTVALGGRLPEVIEQEINYDFPPLEPVTLVAPDSGSLVVKVLAPRGGSLDASTRFAVLLEGLSKKGEDNDSGLTGTRAPITMTTDGQAKLSLIGLNSSYRITLLPEVDCVYARMSLEVEGPKLAGEDVDVLFQLPPQPSRWALKGRAVDETGAALVSTSLRARSGRRNSKSGIPTVSRVTTDKEGNFFFALDFEGSEAGSESSVELIYNFSREYELHASRDLSGWSPGEHELGNVVFEPEPILLSGRVIGPNGKPVPKVSLTFAPLGLKIEGFFTPLTWPQVMTDEEGRFCLRGLCEAKEFKVKASCPGYSDLEETARAGELDLELQLGSKSWLRARLEVEGSDPSRFEGYYYSLRPGGGEAGEYHGLCEAPIDEEVNPGRYDFLVYHVSDGENPIFSKLGLDLLPGRTLDIRTIKLRSPGIKVELTMRSDDVALILGLDGVMRIYEPGSKVVVSETELTVGEDPILLFVEQLPFDVEFECEYMRTIRKRINEARATVELKLGIQVGVEVLGLEELPKEIFCDVLLLPDSRKEENVLRARNRVSRKQPVAEYYLPNPGNFDLFIWLGGPIKKSASFKTCINLETPRRVSVLDQTPTQTFTYKLSRSDIESALAEIEKQR